MTENRMSNLDLIMKEISKKLVKEVQRWPLLYNRDAEGYGDRRLVDQAWREVADSLGLSADTAKKRWTNLRTSYSRSQSSKSEYYLDSHMKFLLPHLHIDRRPKIISSTSLTPAEDYRLELQEVEKRENDSQSDLSVPLGSPDRSRSASPHSLSEHQVYLSSLRNPNYQEPSSSSKRERVPSPSADERWLDAGFRKRRKNNGNGGEEAACPDNLRPSCSSGNGGWQDAGKALLFSLSGLIDSATSRRSNYADGDSEKRNPDLDYLKGLLPQIEQFNTRNKRCFFQKINTLLFTMLDEQEEEEGNQQNVKLIDT